MIRREVLPHPSSSPAYQSIGWRCPCPCPASVLSPLGLQVKLWDYKTDKKAAGAGTGLLRNYEDASDYVRGAGPPTARPDP